MIKRVGAFGGQMGFVARHGRQDRLHRLLAEFLGAFFHALRQQSGGVGLVRVAGRLACRNGGKEAVKGMAFIHGRALAQANSPGPAARKAAKVKHSAIADPHNAAMIQGAAIPARFSPLALAVAGGIAFAYLARLVMMFVAHGWIVDSSLHPIASDFLSFWSAGHLALSGHASTAYDWPAMHRLQHQLMGYEQSGYYGWAYPPLFFCVAIVLALMPYAVSFLVWIVGTLALYAAAMARVAQDRGAALIACAAPATLACA